MNQLLLFTVFGLLLTATAFADEQENSDAKRKPPELTPLTLKPEYNGQRVTVTFTTAGSDGIAQRAVPGKAMSFIILPKARKKAQHFDVWVSGELADVMQRFDMGLFTKTLEKGVVIQAAGKLSYSAPDEYNIHSYRLFIDDWKQFRIIPAAKVKKERHQKEKH